MPLLKSGRITDDPWDHLDDDADLPADDGGPLFIGVERWRRDRDALAARRGLLGLRLDNDQAPATVAEDLAGFAAVALDFPRFGDGRAYSQARLLKERFRFSGEIRARGEVLRDQLRAMHRCGIDAFELTDEVAAERLARDWSAIVGEFRHVYQPAVRGPEPIFQLRHRRVAA